ncbi:hypothetical protein [Paracoccus alkenifer]|uniref:Uncharacterized protein n=1 Tax=Paracoccus alkenifer TaxID=65735 RepID=A0A1H6MPB4_9RHOB|nr:hypothetical protein [Paracoccus alkenifer]SEI03712.1 hypothetical protein SAMN04488075_2361 [Paracoccus alkenifer]
MTEQQINYSKIDEVSEAGICLFKCMMRLEFAVKEAGYVRRGSRNAAEIDWDEYARNRLGPGFWRQVQGAEEIKPLIQTPPKKQIVDDNGSLDWRNAGEVTCVQELIGAVRRVRNNLFHGGKSGDPDAERNDELFAASLCVIELILKKDDRVRTIFTGEY